MCGADLSKGYRDLDDLCKRLHASFHGTEPSESSQSGKVRGNVPAREAEDRRPEPVQHSGEHVSPVVPVMHGQIYTFLLKHACQRT